MFFSRNKLIGITLTSGGVVGVSVGTFYSLKPSSKFKVSKLITDSGRTILKNTDLNWEIKLDIYDRLFSSKISLTSSGENGLKKWCGDILNKTVEISEKDKEDSDYKKALNLCTKPTNKEKLLKNQKKIAGEDDWAQKETNYRSESKTNNLITDIKDKSSATAAEISAWCSKLLDEEILDSENTYNIIDKWCTK